MKNIIILIMVFIIRTYGFSSEYEIPAGGRPPSCDELVSLIIDSLAYNCTDELNLSFAMNSSALSNINLSEAYYLAGMNFYRRNMKMLAYKAFNNGFLILQDGNETREPDMKFRCGCNAASILYKIGKRDEALSTINKVLEISNIKPGLKETALLFKQRISWEYISKTEGLPNESISDMKWKGNDLWIGMWTGGIAKYSEDTGKLIVFDKNKRGPISPQVRNIQVAGTRIWVCTYDGLCFYDTKKKSWKREKGKLGHSLVKKIKTTVNGCYASIFGSGLYRYNRDKSEWKPFFNKSGQITDFVEINRKLYISTLDHGLYIAENKRFVNIAGNYCIKSLCDFNGRIWAGTYGKGILIINNHNAVEKILTVRDGLSSDYIEAMESMGNKLLIGTLGGGACVYHPETDRFKIIDIKQGLPDNDVIKIAFKNKRIWFGTISGGIGILLTENYQDI